MMDEHGFFTPNFRSDAGKQSCEHLGLPEPLRDFFKRFETECVVECCGIDAFCFSAPTAEDLRWARERKISRFLESEIERAEDMSAGVVRIWEINQLLTRDDWILLLRHLAINLES